MADLSHSRRRRAGTTDARGLTVQAQAATVTATQRPTTEEDTAPKSLLTAPTCLTACRATSTAKDYPADNKRKTLPGDLPVVWAAWLGNHSRS